MNPELLDELEAAVAALEGDSDQDWMAYFMKVKPANILALVAEVRRLETVVGALDERMADLAEGVTDRGHGLVFWCCGERFVPLTEHLHREDCFMEGKGGLHDLARAALGGLRKEQTK